MPTSDPAAEAAELCTPPALAELKEYRDEVDMRLFSALVLDPALRIAGSGSGTYFAGSDMFPASNFGVSESSMAESLMEAVVPSVQASEASEAVLLWLVVEEADELTIGLDSPRGNGKLKPFSAYDSLSLSLSSGSN